MPADGGRPRPVPVWHLNPPPPPRAPPPRAPPAPPKGPDMGPGRMLQQQDIMDYNIPAMIYAFWLSIITLCFALFVVFKPGYISGKIEKLFTFLYLVLMVCWVIEAFWTTFPGSSPEALRDAILARTVSVGAGSDHTLTESPGIFGRQMLRNLIGLGQDLAGVTRPIWTLGGERRGRDLGYPGSRRRPARYTPDEEQ